MAHHHGKKMNNSKNDNLRNNNKNNRSRLPQNNCAKCGKRGHFAVDCYSNVKINNGNSNNERTRRQPCDPDKRCSMCTNLGHEMADCAEYISLFDVWRKNEMDGIELTNSSAIPINHSSIANLVLKVNEAVNTAHEAAVIAQNAHITREKLPPNPIIFQNGLNNCGETGCKSTACSGRMVRAFPLPKSIKGKTYQRFHPVYQGGVLAGNTRVLNKNFGASTVSSWRTNYVSGKGYVQDHEIPYVWTNAPNFSKPCQRPIPASKEWDKLNIFGHWEEINDIQARRERGWPRQGWKYFGVNGAFCYSLKTSNILGIGRLVSQTEELMTRDDGTTYTATVKYLCGCVECKKLFLPEAAAQASIKAERLWGLNPISFRFL